MRIFTQKLLSMLAPSFAISIFVIAVSLPGYSQPMTAKDVKTTVNISEFESINLYDGRFSFRLPLASVGGRGSENSVFLSLSRTWTNYDKQINVGGQWIDSNVMVADRFDLAPVKTTIGGYVVAETKVLDSHDPGCSTPVSTLVAQTVIFNGFNGNSITFRGQTSKGEPWVPNYNGCIAVAPFPTETVFEAWDGSGAKFISDSPIPISHWGEERAPTGMIRFMDGTAYRVDYGLVVWAQDRNGNRSYTNYDDTRSPHNQPYEIPSDGAPPISSVKDALDREITVSSTEVAYMGNEGVTRTIAINSDFLENVLADGYPALPLDELFPWFNLTDINAPPESTDPLRLWIVKEVVMPNGESYQFRYNSYGEIARVVMPTGGAIEYDYEFAAPVDESNRPTRRRLLERRVYSDGTTLDNTTQYAYDNFDQWVNQYPTEVTTTVSVFDSSDTLIAKSKHYFGGCWPANNPYSMPCFYPTSVGMTPAIQFANSFTHINTGRELKSESFAADGTTVLRRTETQYAPRAYAVWSGGTTDIPIDPRVIEVKTTLADSGQLSKVTYGYDATTLYNLRTDVYEYDLGSVGSWVVGGFLRRSHTDYEKGSAYTADAVHILNLPTQSWVSSDSDGDNKISLTTYEYDNYAADSSHAPLIDRPSITGHNSNFGTGYITRGNLTGTTGYASASNQTGEVSVYSQYDIAGNVVKAIDGMNNETTIDYADRFGEPDGNAQSNSAPSILAGVPTYGFATSATNDAGWTTYSQRDYFTGGVVDAEDINGNITTNHYQDALDRPTQTISNSTSSTLKTQTTIDYDDDDNKVTITADSKGYDDNLLKTEAFYDGFGRTVESRSYETSSSYMVTKTEFDDIGRPYKACNPYRPYLNETAQWTTTAFDSLGRVTSVTTADNAVAPRSYYGTSVMVQDQAGRQRAGTSDALGRLNKVIEQDGANQVEQSVNASLNLTDPITANSGWSVKYVYDNNGNITSTTDALNRTVTGTYDNLNRLTHRDYSDPAMADVTFTYDNTNIANSKGKLTAVISDIYSTNFTAFDVLGRVKSSSQTIGDQTYTFADYSYDLSGALVSQTYPSGRVVTNESDDLGRLETVKSQLPNDVPEVMLSQLAYTSFGAVKQAKLGNGRWESAVVDNKRLQITQIGLGGSAGDTSILKLEFGYGTTSNNGSLLQQKITIPGAAHQITQNYLYDNFNRLWSANEVVNSVETWKQTFSYDRFGNRRFDANNTTTLGSCSQAVCNPDIELGKNQFKNADGYTYNAEGSLTANPESQTFSYDSENRLIQVQNSSTQQTADYVYDGQGKRVKKKVGNEETYFVYDAFGKLVAEYTTNQTITQNGTQYLSADQLGSPRVVTNAIGAVVSRHDYVPYGEEIMSGGGRTSGQGYGVADNARQKFTGYERDGESGLDFAQNRYFSSKHGRFTSVDPLAASANIKTPQTLNRYNYGNNSPYKFTDPLGLAPCGNNAENGRPCTFEDDMENGGYRGRTDSAFGAFTQREFVRNDTYLATGYDTALGRYRGDVEVGYTNEACANLSLCGTETLHNPTLEQVTTLTYSHLANANQTVEILYDIQRMLDANNAINSPLTGLSNLIQRGDRAGDGYRFSVAQGNQTAFDNFLKGFRKGRPIYHQEDAGCKQPGAVCADYRSDKGSFGIKGSIQIVYNSESGRGYIDVDRFNPYQFPGGTFGHLFAEILLKEKGPVAYRPASLERALRPRSDY